MGKLTINQWMGLKEIKGFELAEKTGLTEGTISNIRQGKVKPKLETIQKIAEVLEIGIDEIEI